jgi:hypothetical protein
MTHTKKRGYPTKPKKKKKKKKKKKVQIESQFSIVANCQIHFQSTQQVGEKHSDKKKKTQRSHFAIFFFFFTARRAPDQPSTDHNENVKLFSVNFKSTSRPSSHQTIKSTNSDQRSPSNRAMSTLKGVPSQMSFEDRMAVIDNVLLELETSSMQKASIELAVKHFAGGAKKVAARLRMEVDAARELRDSYKQQRDQLREELERLKLQLSLRPSPTTSSTDSPPVGSPVATAQLLAARSQSQRAIRSNSNVDASPLDPTIDRSMSARAVRQSPAPYNFIPAAPTPMSPIESPRANVSPVISHAPPKAPRPSIVEPAPMRRSPAAAPARAPQPRTPDYAAIPLVPDYEQLGLLADGGDDGKTQYGEFDDDQSTVYGGFQ